MGWLIALMWLFAPDGEEARAWAARMAGGDPAGAEERVELFAVESHEGLSDALKDAKPVWESVLGPPPGRGTHADVVVRRLYADGTLWTWSNTRRTKDARGLPRPVPAPARWRLSAKLGAIEPVVAAVGAQFLALPAQVGVRKTGENRMLGWRAARPDGSVHVVNSLDGVELDAVKAVERALAAAIVPGGVPLEQQE
jgi:hypothetical protein